MIRIHTIFLLAALALAALSGSASSAMPLQAELYGTPGPFQVDAAEYALRDVARQRDIPLKLYMPAGKGPFPVIIFSHGLGGSRDGYEYLGRHWASHGYISVHPTHIGSDASVLKKGGRAMDALARAADDPQNAINRPRDVSSVIDQLTSMTLGAGPLHGKVDIGRIGVAGHSFGANTALAISGQTFVGPLGRSFKLADRRVKAAVLLSAPANRRNADILDRAYGSIRIPCLFITGTNDHSPIGTCLAQDRRIPFDNMYGVDCYLLTMNGADHMVFSGRRFDPAHRDGDKVYHQLILSSSIAFWEAYLRDDAIAKGWLADGEFKEDLDGDGTFEIKQKE
ncbi:MAG: dienelactone hydrolase [Candidatus Sumerlaeia bacterium]